MIKRHAPAGAFPHAGKYEIRLGGQLDTRWATWFDGMAVERGTDGTTVLRGELPDQSALHGVLQRARDLGMPLVSVRRLEAVDSTDPVDPAEPHARKDTTR